MIKSWFGRVFPVANKQSGKPGGGKICRWPLDELVILSDGLVTSCCLDPERRNAFASIYEHDYRQVFFERFAEFRRRMAADLASYPNCVACFEYNAGLNERRGKLYFIEKATKDELADFLVPERLPKRLVIELTSVCNLKCIDCVHAHVDLKDLRLDRKSFLDVGRLKEWLEPFIAKLEGIRLYNYGETFIHPEAIDFISWLGRMNPTLKIGIATNGLLLDKEPMLERLVAAQPAFLKFSVHGGSQEAVEKFMGRGSDYEKVVMNMKKLVGIRERMGYKSPLIGWKCVLFEWNDSDEEMDKIRKKAGEIGVDFYGFDLTAGPYKSKRFTQDSAEWRALQAQGEDFNAAAKEKLGLDYII